MTLQGNTPATSTPRPTTGHPDASRSGACTPAYQQPTARQLEHQRQRGAGRVALGALMLALGLLITLVTVINFPHSGFFFIAFGPVIAGVLRIGSGVKLCRDAAETTRQTKSNTA